MSITLSVEVNNTFIYANFLSTTMKKALDNIGIKIDPAFIGSIKFKDILPCIHKLLEIIHKLEKEICLDEPSNDTDAWLSRYRDILTVFTTAYTFGKDIHYA